jgi:hypothetical protein
MAYYTDSNRYFRKPQWCDSLNYEKIGGKASASVAVTTQRAK